MKEIADLLLSNGFTAASATSETLECWKRVLPTDPHSFKGDDAALERAEALGLLYGTIYQMETMSHLSASPLRVSIKITRKGTALAVLCDAGYRE